MLNENHSNHSNHSNRCNRVDAANDMNDADDTDNANDKCIQSDASLNGYILSGQRRQPEISRMLIETVFPKAACLWLLDGDHYMGMHPSMITLLFYPDWNQNFRFDDHACRGSRFCFLLYTSPFLCALLFFFLHDK